MLLSWQDSLFQKLKSKRHDSNRFPRICLIGIGNDLRGDDSAGLIVARKLLADKRFFSKPNLLIIDGGPAPENHTGKLRSFQPELVLFIDAAHLDEPPGAIRWIPLESIDGMSASSHSLPLSILARYVSCEFGCQVEVLGIQPVQNELGTELTLPVRTAVEEIVCQMSNLFS